MTSHVPPLPVGLDPLIAEAKRRARQRRLLLLALVVALVGGGIVGRTLASRNSERPRPAIVAAPRCRTSQLHLSWDPAGAAGGSVYDAFRFTNTSSGACSLHGWPTFRFVMRGGQVILPRPHDLISTAYRVANPPPIPHVVLQPNGTTLLSDFEADGTGYTSPCRSTRTVLVTPPGARTPLSVNARLFYCGPHDMWVLPIGRRN